MSKRRLHPRKATKLRMKDLSKKWEKRTRDSRLLIAWRFLKGIIFIFCLSLFFFQSAKFLEVYNSYPTTTKIEFTYPGEFELPAVTFCNMNPTKRSKFCAEYPNLCESPENITEVCEVNPFLCKDNPSHLVIPKLGFLTNNSKFQEVIQAMNEIYFKGNATKEFWEEWAWSIEAEGQMKPVFAWTGRMYFPCYTENLLLNSTDEPEKMRLRYRQEEILKYDLSLESSEEMRIQVEPNVFFSIHSPFVPVNVLNEGKRLKLDHKYNIYIKLAEEKLLPFPYETDCTNYEDLWSKNNHQGPRSQEMCKELCGYKLYETGKNISLRFQLLEYPLKLCFGEECERSPKTRELLRECTSSCKQSCRVLKYSITVIETSQDSSKIENRNHDLKKEKIQVEVFLGDSQVVVERHAAEYDTGNLFSYIGGLMGCWLGVSIWAFAGIAENVVRRAILWMERIKRYFKESSQARRRVFTKHRDNWLNIKIV